MAPTARLGGGIASSARFGAPPSRVRASLASTSSGRRVDRGNAPGCTCAVDHDRGSRGGGDGGSSSDPGVPRNSLDFLRREFERNRASFVERTSNDIVRGLTGGRYDIGGKHQNDQVDGRGGSGSGGKNNNKRDQVVQIINLVKDIEKRQIEEANQVRRMRNDVTSAALDLLEELTKEELTRVVGPLPQEGGVSGVGQGNGAVAAPVPVAAPAPPPVVVQAPPPPPSNPYPGVEQQSVQGSVHPGVDFQTKSYIDLIEGEQKAVVTMQTEVYLRESRMSLDEGEMQALAARSLAESATALAWEKVEDAIGGASPTVRSHAEIVRTMQYGKIVSAKDNDLHESAFGHESFLVTLQDEETGHTVNTLFKPRVDGDAEGWHRAPIEWLAYELNIMLGLDLVPPVAYRTGGVDVAYRHFDEGAFIYYADNCTELRDTSPDQWGMGMHTLLSDTRILDVLLHNSDRHHGHFLLGEHWVKGEMVDEGEGGRRGWKGAMRPILIDHAAGFRSEAFVSLTHQNAFQTGAIRTISPHTYMRLRFLDAKTLRGRFQGVLSDREVLDMYERLSSILDYFDNLVREHGYDNVIIGPGN